MSSTTETTQPETSSTTNTERVLGLVKWFQGGFGFVTNFDTKEDVFVHHSSVTTTVDCWKLLYPGEYVDFSVETMEDGKSQAANVTGVRGGPLRCETLALLRQERDEYNRENRTEDQESGSTHNTSGRTRGGRGTRGRGRGNRSSGPNTSS
jgi:cold shock CspA family protein